VRLKAETNFPQVQRALAQLQDDVAKRATVSAVNKTITQGRTQMSKEIRAEFNIKADRVNRGLVIKRATFNGGLFTIEAELYSPAKKGRSINLINFAARQTSKGVTFAVKRGAGRKLIPGAFIGNNGRTVFIRVPGTVMASRSTSMGAKHREAIKALQVIDVPQMFNTKRINARVVQFLKDKFPEVFSHEVQFYLNRFNQGVG
jgi:hypothetical protein